MGPVGIVTLTGNGNFGNRLQNFALQEALKGLGVTRVDTIKNTHRAGKGGSAITRRVDWIRTNGVKSVAPQIKRKMGRAFGPPNPAPTHPLGADRETAIGAFIDERIGETRSDYRDVEAARELVSEYDFFVAGSDQIWNPRFGLCDHLRFLEFANADQRIAYAASFGIPSLPAHLRKTYRSGIAGMPRVSVREQRAAYLVRELTGREVPVVLDPTMVLDPREWEGLAVTPQSLQGGGYVAEFFLGSSTVEQMPPVTRYASDRGLERVDLNSDAREDLAAMGPLEFIGAIKNSSLLITDSFHAAVFATIFNIPYVLRGRGAMNSRFDTLLSKSGLQMPRWETLKELEASIDVDWDSVRENLARERAASLAYLTNALALPIGA